MLLGWLRKEAREMRGGEPLSALNALCEALATHNVIVSWDALFRRTMVTPSGFTFETMLHLLASLSAIGDARTLFLIVIQQMVQVQIAEVGPAVEQIPLLHRMDHSLHTYRLWVLAAARNHIGGWKADEFVLTSQTDVADVVNDLGRLTVRKTHFCFKCNHKEQKRDLINLRGFSGKRHQYEIKCTSSSIVMSPII
jgi:Coiled-coil protein 142